MNEFSNNDAASNNKTMKPGLKKVKKPIRKIKPQAPIEDKSLAANNPFEQNLQKNSSSANAFDVDSILNINNLPSTKTAEQPQFKPQTPQFIEDEHEAAYGTDYYQVETSNSHTKMIMVAAFAAFVVGFFVSRLFFSEQKVTRNGLQGVVVNAEVPHGRARCGMAEAGQGCVLY